MFRKLALTAAAVAATIGALPRALADAPAAPLVISEFRLRGPNGANDEFVEIHNASDMPFTVQAADGSAGFALAASDGAARFVIPNGTVIPARGYVLGVNWLAYNLAGAAAGDFTYATDIPDNAGIALFSTANAANFSLATRLDAVGSTSEANALYKEGAGYPAITPYSINYSWVRRVPGAGFANRVANNQAAMPTECLAPDARASQDTGDNAQDFLFVDTNATGAGAGHRLGAPGPQNLQSLVTGGGVLMPARLDRSAHVSATPNFVRDFASDQANNSTFGTVTIRRQITNATSQPITSLRFRVADLNTFPAPSGLADLRVRTIADASVQQSDGATAGVLGTTLVQPPSQWNGGGYNSVLSVPGISAAQPLMPGQSVNVQFLLGIQQTGSFRFFVETEANGLPGIATWGVIGGTDGAPPDGWVDCAVLGVETSTQIEAIANWLKVGEPVTLTATVTPEDGVPTGEVTFTDAQDTTLGIATLDANGQAEITLTTLPAGTHVVTATYAGTDGYKPSRATLALPIVVRKHATTTMLGVSSERVRDGDPVTLTATVPDATGEVAFYSGTVQLGLAALDGGVATLSDVVLPLGLHSVTASFAGTAKYEASTSSAVQVRVLHATTLAVTATESVVNEGDAIVLDVSAPAGTVLVHEGETLVATVTIDGAGAQATIEGAAPGEHAYVASFEGSDTYAPATSQPVTVLVNAATSMQLVAPDAALLGEDAFVTVTVSATTGAAQGTVMFVVDEAVGFEAVPLDVDGKALFSTAAFDVVGRFSVAAIYEPARGFAPSEAEPVTVHVVAATTTQLTAPAKVKQGETVTLDALVESSSGEVGGLVEFRVGSEVLGSAALDASGHATFETAELPLGRHAVTAHYLGAGDLLPSASLAADVLVQAETAVALDARKADGKVVLTATVRAGEIAATGEVEFFAGDVSLGRATLDEEGVATLTTDALAAGEHTLIARYDGSELFVGSESAEVTLVVEKAPVDRDDDDSKDASGCGCSAAPAGSIALSLLGLLGLRRRKAKR